jgi:hypothetical protein
MGGASVHVPARPADLGVARRLGHIAEAIHDRPPRFAWRSAEGQNPSLRTISKSRAD